MCSINGFLKFKPFLPGSKPSRIFNIIEKGESRGKDSFGLYVFNDNDAIREFKYIDRPSNVFQNDPIKLYHDDFLLLNNNRAEPTTEYVKEKRKTDVQPFSSNTVAMVHNGTIANDKELIEKYGLKLSTRIDSAVIPEILERSDWTQESLFNCLTEELIGSYALAAYSTKYSKLLLATNYKPLNLLYDRKEMVLYFSSLESYLVDDDYNRIYGSCNLIEVKPYTALLIDRYTGLIEQFSLYKKKEGKKKALICASSGMDSTVAATWAKNQGYDVTLLHFQYQCRAQKKEEESIKKISEYLGVPTITIQADFFKGVLGGSRLYDGSDITKEGDKGAELAIEWVPARNLIFLSIAAGYAEAKGIDYIVLGGNLEESGAYADNELIFQRKFGDLLPNALNLQNKVEVLTPVADLMKHDIVKLGLEIGAPLHLTWSCYENGQKHCGKCGPCFMRKTAFQMLNQSEVIEYAE